MSIPVHLQSFKSSGIYRLTFDKSTILNQDTNIMRLVVGYSEKGPFNTPVYIKSISDFKAVYGDVSKKMEKRGVWFNKLALQALAAGPILCLNLKKFDGETVGVSNIDTSFNVTDPISNVEVKVEDIFDTTRFWVLSADKLGEIKDTNGKDLSGYIRIATTNTSNTSTSYFIRKASGAKVAGYNVTVSDWYKDSGEDVPEYLQNNLNCKMSDFMAEIYIFKGKFNAAQVLASETLSNYFEVVKTGSVSTLQLKPYVKNVYGECTDTLDALYVDATSGAIGHYVGSLIPLFKDKVGQYQSLDIKFNDDVESHNLMMYFDVDALEEGRANIDLSGHQSINDKVIEGDIEGKETYFNLENIFKGDAQTSVLGNKKAPVVSEIIEFNAEPNKVAISGFDTDYVKIAGNKITGNYYVSAIDETNKQITLLSYFKVENSQKQKVQPSFILKFNTLDDLLDELIKLGITRKIEGENETPYYYGGVYGGTKVTTYNLDDEDASTGTLDSESGINMQVDKQTTSIDFMPDAFVTSVYGFKTTKKANTDEHGTVTSYVPEYGKDTNIILFDGGVTVVVTSTFISAKAETSKKDNVYGASVSFVPLKDWTWNSKTGRLESTGSKNLATYFSEGDCVVATNNTMDNDSYHMDNVYVQEVGSEVGEGKITYFVKFTGQPYEFEGVTQTQVAQAQEGETQTTQPKKKYLVRIDAACNQEIGVMEPIYLEGYTYKNSKPASTSMLDKLNWQNFILSVLTEYKGIRTALLEKSEVDYRYIIDTFESYVGPGCKNVLTFLAKEKQSAFAILNFPAIKTFVKCPYASFTDSKGVFDTKYVVKGFNPSKSHSLGFSIPSEAEGASFGAFYTSLKFSDGYLDSVVPSAALVSNLFMEKYLSRQPYYIVAGPNYGAISASGLVGPDYNFCRAELDDLEPFGINAMVYRPGFGTFINSNQTAKQTPVSALSKVNIRELVIYLQDEIEKLLQSYQWEFNNQTVRNKIKDKADSICLQIQKNGGIIDFLNVMDESNNTPDIIDNEMAVLSTHIEPGRGMGKMVHELTLYRTGMMRASISE